jgi:hypothetical protein
MRLQTGANDSRSASGALAWPLQVRDACCLLVAIVFAVRAIAGLVLPEGSGSAITASEGESCAEELESDESGDSLGFVCLCGSLPQLSEGPSQVLALAAGAIAAPRRLSVLLARGPPA